MSVHTVTVPSTSLNPATLKAISFVGSIVTYQGEQFLCYSVEGYDYYAFVSSLPDSLITVDFGMTPSEYNRKPRAFLLPMGCKIGDGYGFEVYLSNVRKGVSLAKV